MKFTVLQNLDASYKPRWEKQFVAVERNYLESIWRRSEEAEPTATGERRRMIHVIDGYELLPNSDGTFDFAITNCYMWLCSTLPRDELARYATRIRQALAAGGWQQHDNEWHLNDLRFSYSVDDVHPEDRAADRHINPDYQTISCTLVSNTFPADRITQESPWAVYKTGVRQQGSRVEHPQTVTNMKELLQYLPAQIELGGGASLELGIPPLNYFHATYNLYTHDHTRFAYGDSDDLMAEVLTDPESFYADKASVPYAKALTATPNSFYLIMAELYQQGHIVGPVVTNNFDGICSLVGLKEMYVRRYDETHIVPEVDFPPEAKSLLVVGSHADRRRIQQAAKQRGLKIIYVDPESYTDHEGNRIAYPLEKIEADDLLVPLAASTFAEQLKDAISQSTAP